MVHFDVQMTTSMMDQNVLRSSNINILTLDFFKTLKEMILMHQSIYVHMRHDILF